MVDDSACNGDNELPGELPGNVVHKALRFAPHPSLSGRTTHCNPSHPTRELRSQGTAFRPEPLLIRSHATHSFLFFILTTQQLREIHHNIHFNHNQFLRNSWWTEARLIIRSNTNRGTTGERSSQGTTQCLWLRFAPNPSFTKQSGHMSQTTRSHVTNNTVTCHKQSGHMSQTIRSHVTNNTVTCHRQHGHMSQTIRSPSHPIAPNQGTTFTRHCVSPRTHPHSVTCNSFIHFFIITTHQLREIRPFNHYSLILICRWNIYSLGFPNRLILSPSTDLVFETILPALFTIKSTFGHSTPGNYVPSIAPRTPPFGELKGKGVENRWFSAPHYFGGLRGDACPPSVNFIRFFCPCF